MCNTVIILFFLNPIGFSDPIGLRQIHPIGFSSPPDPIGTQNFSDQVGLDRIGSDILPTPTIHAWWNLSGIWPNDKNTGLMGHLHLLRTWYGCNSCTLSSICWRQSSCWLYRRHAPTITTSPWILQPKH